VIDRVRKSGQQGDDNAAFPRRAISVCLNNPMDQSVTDLVLNLDVVDSRPGASKDLDKI
jgi:hypothetical protein